MQELNCKADRVSAKPIGAQPRYFELIWPRKKITIKSKES